MNPASPGAGAPRAPRSSASVPLERGRAAGLLGGLIAFTAGLAAAALLVLAGYGSTPPYLVSITIALVGVGAMGYFYHRGTVALPAGRIWSPAVLRAVISALDLPVLPIIAVLYAFAAIGVVGNLLVPLLIRR